MNRKQRITLGFAVVVIGGIVVYSVQRWRDAGTYVSTDNATVEGVIIPIRAKVAGTVQAVPVSDNDAVRAGTVLVQLRDGEFAQRVEQADAEYAALLVAAGKAGGPGQLDSQVRAATANTNAARASIQQLQASLTNAQADYGRARQLAAQGMMTRQALDAARTRADTLAHSVDAARSTSQAAYEGVLAQKAELKTQGYRIDAAKARLEIARIQFADSRLTAPRNGVVSRKDVQPGQFVVVGQQLMSVTDLDDVWIVANLKETDVGRVKVGQTAQIVVDAYPGQAFDGVVQSIGSATGSKFSLLPQENATGNFTKVVQRIPVKIVLKHGTSERATPLRPGMSAFVRIRTAGDGA
ncbi:HlyD family secretion protein [Burkholderia sp. Ac-20353]|nr:HlyD family secretion protein [Burkholderia sp. Ac-20353]MBN3790356.1 HlyD family secretion protein [Burkholderia sp. Ac-20353]